MDVASMLPSRFMYNGSTTEHFAVCVYCNRSQMTSQRVKKKKYETRRSRVGWLLFFTRCSVFCDLLQYTRTEKCNLFVLFNKNSKGIFKDLGGYENRKTSSLTCYVYFNRSRSTIIYLYKRLCITYLCLFYTLQGKVNRNQYW